MLRASKSTGCLLEPDSNDSSDTIGDDADVTMLMEDSPLVPSISFLHSSDLFKPKGYKRIDSGGEVKGKGYSKRFSRHQRFGSFNKSFNPNSYFDFEPFPSYLGFYFREIYRTTLQELLQQNRGIRTKLGPLEKNEDENVDLPEMSKKALDDNKTHVTQSMQSLYYMNSIKPTDAYKSLKKILPKTTKKKLAIFDMDETLIH